MNPTEQRIRELAYQIWETEGKPAGEETRHWEMARKLAESEAVGEEKPAIRTRRVSKPKTTSISDAEQPALLKKPRAPRASTPKTPKN